MKKREYVKLKESTVNVKVSNDRATIRKCGNQNEDPTSNTEVGKTKLTIFLSFLYSLVSQFYNSVNNMRIIHSCKFMYEALNSGSLSYNVNSSK